MTIPAGQASATVAVTPVNDADFEGSETVDVTVLPDGAYTVGSPSAATVTITDNDRPTVTIVATDASASETRTGHRHVHHLAHRTDDGGAARHLHGDGLGAREAWTTWRLASQVFIPAGSST